MINQDNKKAELVGAFANEVEPMYAMMFPMIHGIWILADKMECKARSYKLQMRKQQKHDIGEIERTAAKLRRLCMMFNETYLMEGASEAERDHVDLVMLQDSNAFLYMIARLNNALVGGCTDEDLLKLDSFLKVMTRDAHARGLINEELIQEFTK